MCSHGKIDLSGIDMTSVVIGVAAGVFVAVNVVHTLQTAFAQKENNNYDKIDSERTGIFRGLIYGLTWPLSSFVRKCEQRR